MFSLKNKLNPNLRTAMTKKQYKTYRVLVQCKTLQDTLEKKVKTYKGELIRSIPSLNCFAAQLTDHAIERLTEYPETAFISFDSTALLCASSVLTANGISFQEKYKLTGKGIGVGIVDSGTYPHTDLMNPNKIKGFLDLINNFKYPYDDNGHGTFISGLICSSGISSKGMYRGIAENSHLYSVKAFNSLGKGFVSDVLFGIAAIINAAEENKIRVLCLPFELLENDYFILSLFSKAFQLAVDRKMIVVVPSGHNGNNEGSMRGIATLNSCITVGGLDTRSKLTSYVNSSCGSPGKLEKPDVSAACVDLCSLNSNTQYLSEKNGIKLYTQPLEKPYTSYTGTSCAAAYVSGICAMLLENNPALTFKDILPLLKVSSKLHEIPKGLQGSGSVDINKLLP